MIEVGNHAGRPARRRARRHALAMGTALGLLAVAVPTVAQTSGSGPLPAADQRVFAIPASSLSDSLTVFGQQSGLQVSVDASLVRDIAVSGVSGVMSPAQALDRLTAGTGLAYRINGNTVTLERLQRGGDAIQLGPVRVEGQSDEQVLIASRAAESPFGPGNSYVASRSETGTKTNASILDTPQTINVITRAQMDDQAIQSVPQALRYTPGVGTELSGVDNRIETNQILIRGFTPDEYLDGLRLQVATWASPQIEPNGLDRIEILKGPASVLYGQASPGGILNLSSKRPTDTPIHELSIEGGSFGLIQGTFDFGGPIDADDRFSYRVSGTARDSDTQVDHTGSRRFSISPAFTWKPDDDTSLTFLSNFQSDPEAGFFNQLPPEGTLLPDPHGKISTSFYSGEPDLDKYDRTQGYLGYAFEHRFDDVWSVAQNFRFIHVDGDFFTTYPYALEPDGRTLDRSTFGEVEHLASVTLDTHGQAVFDTSALHHTVLIGVDYLNSVDAGAGRDGDAPPIDVFAPVYGAPIGYPPIDFSNVQEQNQVGLYFQDQIKLDNWTLLVSGRQDWTDSEATDRLAGTKSDQSADAFTWRAGLDYRFDNGIAPYFSYSKSFQPTSGLDHSGNQFKPTTGEQYEVGVKYQPRDVNALITASLFEITQQNVLTADPAHQFFSVQQGEVRVRGAELEAKANLWSGVSLIGSYTYLDPVVTKANDMTLGKNEYGIPKQTLAAWADYTVPEGPASGLGFGGGVRWVGASYADSLNTLKTPSYTLVDLAVHYDLGKLDPRVTGTQLSLNVTNLFDETYLAYCSDYGCGYGVRRAVFATVKYRW